MTLTQIGAIFTALGPIFSWVAPICTMSIAFYFIRSFFD